MNRFLQKVRQGASKASEKAQHVMELNRVQGQIDARHKQWKHNAYELGCIAYEAYKNDTMASIREQMDELAKENVQLETEIEQLEWKRCELRNEKRCTCGQTADWEANFCAKCGSKLPEPPTMTYESATAVEKGDLWETQDLHPYRHNGSSKLPVLDKEDSIYYFNSEDEEHLQPYPDSSGVKGNGTGNSDAEPLSLSSADHRNGENADAESWTWNFPERETLSRSGKQQPNVEYTTAGTDGVLASIGHVENKYVTKGKSCAHCGASGVEEAKWCERCGTPFM